MQIITKSVSASYKFTETFPLLSQPHVVGSPNCLSFQGDVSEKSESGTMKFDKTSHKNLPRTLSVKQVESFFFVFFVRGTR